MGPHNSEYFARQKAAKNRSLEIEANSINLPMLLSSHGYKVKRESHCNDYGVSNTPIGSFGIKFKGTVWLAYQNDKDGFRGNAVQLIQRIENCDKKTAIQKILGNIKINPSVSNNTLHIQHSQKMKEKVMIVTPPTTSNISEGQAYLLSRGIDIETFESWRTNGSAEYSWNGLAFISRNFDGDIGLIEVRLFKPMDIKDKPGKFTNHLVKGSRDNCVVIPGSPTCKDIAFVEGNFDGLALCEINQRSLPADEQPTIIICGGKDNLKMLRNPVIDTLLSTAINIVCWGDNEMVNIDDPTQHTQALAAKQDITDKAHAKRIEEISSLNSTANIQYLKPPFEIHDLADWNKMTKILQKPALTKQKLKF